MESKHPDEPQTKEPEESLQSSQLKKIGLGLLCGLATSVAGWYLGTAAAAAEAYFEFNKPAFGGRIGGIVAGVVGGFLGGVLMTALMTTGVPAIVGAWLGYTRGIDAVKDFWKATTDTVYGFTRALKDKVYEWTEKPRSVWNMLTSYVSKITDAVTSVFTTKKPNTGSVAAKAIAVTDDEELDRARPDPSAPSQSLDSRARNSSTTAHLLSGDSALRSSVEPGRPPPEAPHTPLMDSRPEEGQVRQEGEPAPRPPRPSAAGMLSNSGKQPAPKEEEGLGSKFKKMIGLK